MALIARTDLVLVSGQVPCGVNEALKSLLSPGAAKRKGLGGVGVL